MKTLRGETQIGIGSVMVVLGMIIPWLVMLKIIPSTFFILILSHVMSVAGFFLGVSGVAYAVDHYKAKKRARLHLRRSSERSLERQSINQGTNIEPSAAELSHIE